MKYREQKLSELHKTAFDTQFAYYKSKDYKDVEELQNDIITFKSICEICDTTPNSYEGRVEAENYLQELWNAKVEERFKELEEQERIKAEEKAKQEQEELTRKKGAEEKRNAEYKSMQEEFDRKEAEYGLKGIKDKNEMHQRIESIIAKGLEYKDGNPEEYAWIGIINQGYEKFEETYLKLKEYGVEQKLFDSFLNVEGLTYTQLLDKANWLLKIYQRQKEVKKGEPKIENNTQGNDDKQHEEAYNSVNTESISLDNEKQPTEPLASIESNEEINEEKKESNILESNPTEEVEGSVTEQILEESTKIEDSIQGESIEQENNEVTGQDTVTQEPYIPQHMRDDWHMRSVEEMENENGIKHKEIDKIGWLQRFKDWHNQSNEIPANERYSTVKAILKEIKDLVRMRNGQSQDYEY